MSKHSEDSVTYAELADKLAAYEALKIKKPSAIWPATVLIVIIITLVIFAGLFYSFSSDMSAIQATQIYTCINGLLLFGILLALGSILGKLHEIAHLLYHLITTRR